MKETIKVEAGDRKLGMTLEELRGLVHRLEEADDGLRIKGRCGSWKDQLQWLSVTIE